MSAMRVILFAILILWQVCVFRDVALAACSDEDRAKRDHADVIVAILCDGSALPVNSLKSYFWNNEKELNGVHGVDDDHNGWVDDRHGVSTNGAVPLGTIASVTTDLAEYVAGAWSMRPDGSAPATGQLRILPIAVYKGNWVLDAHAYDYYSLTVDEAAIIAGFDYAQRMGARVILMPDPPHSLSPAVIAAARRFSGLILCLSFSRYMPGRLSSGLLLEEHLDHVLSVTGWSGDMLGAFDYRVSEYPRSRAARSANVYYFEWSGAPFAAVAADLAARFPRFDGPQLRRLLLGAVAPPYVQIYGGIQSIPELDPGRALLGRSVGGCFYTGDWVRADRFEESVEMSSRKIRLAYDATHGDLYILFLGYGNAALAVWNGQLRSMQELPVKVPVFEYGAQNPVLVFNEQRGFLTLIDVKGKPWHWTGSQWLELPKVGDHYGYTDFNAFRYVVYDAATNRLIWFDVSENHVLTYDWNRYDKYQAVGESVPWSLVEHYANAAFDDRSGSMLIFDEFVRMHQGGLTSPRSRMRGYWSLQGTTLSYVRTNTIPGSGGVLLYDSTGNQVLRLGSMTHHRGGVQNPDIWSLRDGVWKNLGYDLPRQFDDVDFDAIWMPDRKRLALVSGDTFRQHSLWTWSGAIATTWIDNLVLPQSDYTGDGKADAAVWRPTTGEFLVRGAMGAVIGKPGDTPVPADYDGDGRTEFAVFRPVYNPNDTATTTGSDLWQFDDNSKLSLGRLNDIPVPGNYFNIRRAIPASYNKDTATWTLRGRHSKQVQFGNPADLPVPADYTGSGITALATYSPLTSTWHIQGIGDIAFGEPGDSPVPADYDGDGRIDIAVFNPRTARWSVRSWQGGGTLFTCIHGATGEIPVPGDYSGDGVAEPATFDPFTAVWNIRGGGTFTFGQPGDVPLVRGN